MLFLPADHGGIIRSGCILREFDFLLDHRKDLALNVSLCKIITRNSQICALYALTSIFRYNMVGHSKFCLLLLGGALLFRETLAINQLVGITLTLVGIILYAHVKVSLAFLRYAWSSRQLNSCLIRLLCLQMKDNHTVAPEFEERETKPLHKV